MTGDTSTPNSLKRYLSFIGFSLNINHVYHPLPHLFDVVFALISAIISICCIGYNEASLVVLLINALYLGRNIMKNHLNNEQTTEKLEKENGITRCAIRTHYYTKKIIGIVIFFTVAIIWVINSFEMSLLIVKTFSIILVLMVLIDDLDGTIIDLYRAEMNIYI